MAEYVALMWDIKPESQDAVRELFHNYGRPDHTIRDEDGNEVGTLHQHAGVHEGHDVCGSSRPRTA